MTSEMARNAYSQALELQLPSAVIPKQPEEFVRLRTNLEQLERWTAVARALLPTYASWQREYKVLSMVLK